MRYVLAISGGVDSVVLLDMAIKGLLSDIDKDNLLVAHFNHGIRPASSDDGEFVRKLAEKYGLEFQLGNGNLGKDAGEELARKKRYEFLRKISKDGKIVTAHHQDDLIETILINLIRGTGWRGLAPFWSDDIIRPLLNKTKAEIVEYAIKNNLEWVDDETNFSDRYLRNRVRNISSRMTVKQRQELLKIYEKQAKIRDEIESSLGGIVWDRKILDLPEEVAIEVLRNIVGAKLTIPQTKRLLKNLKTAKSGDILQPGGGIQIGIYKDSITISSLCTS